MRARTRATVVAALALALAGCSGNPDPALTTGYSEPTTEEPPTTELVELAVGETHTTDLGSEITIHEARINIPSDYPPDEGGLWHAADAEYCIGDTPPDQYAFEAFTWDWVMRTAEGHVLGHPSSWDDALVSPRLDLSSSTPIPNECYRGWVLFSGPEDATPTSVRLDNMDWSI